MRRAAHPETASRELGSAEIARRKWANHDGAAFIPFLNMTGTLGGAANAQLPTVAALLAALHTPIVGRWILPYC
jgi:hypothetical protein